MATSKKLHQNLEEVTECPICTETMEDPKILPCIHTFCLKCLNQYWRDKEPGDSVACPLCRNKFLIPTGGLLNLRKNLFVEKLLESKKLSGYDKPETTCDSCSGSQNVGSQDSISLAIKFCCECRQNLCEQCVKAHMIKQGMKSHKILPVTDIGQTLNVLHLGKRCDLHETEMIDLFCVQCSIGVCATCFLLEHNGHTSTDTNTAADILRSKIRNDIDDAEQLVLNVNSQTENLDKYMSEFVNNVTGCENRISKRGEELKRMIDQHVQALLEELNVKKREIIKEMEITKEDLAIQKISLAGYIKFSQTVLNKASPTDIFRLAEDLKIRADNLKTSKVVREIYPAEIKFLPAGRSLMSGDLRDNIVGQISSTSIELSTSCLSSYKKNPTVTSSIQCQGRVRGVAVSRKECFVAVYNSPELKVYNSDTYSPQTSIKVPGLSDPWDLVANESFVVISEFKKNTIHRVKLPEKLVMVSWQADGSRNGLSITKQGNVLVTCFSLNKLFEYSTDGIKIREIVLQSNIRSPYRAIQLDNDQFLLDHDSPGRVCLIDGIGNVIKSFGGTEGSEGGPLNNPCQFVVDQRGFVLVADYNNSRVVLLDPQLEFVKDLIPSSVGLKKVYALYLDEHCGELYVSDYLNNKLVVYQL